MFKDVIDRVAIQGQASSLLDSPHLMDASQAMATLEPHLEMSTTFCSVLSHEDDPWSGSRDDQQGAIVSLSAITRRTQSSTTKVSVNRKHVHNHKSNQLLLQARKEINDRNLEKIGEEFVLAMHAEYSDSKRPWREYVELSKKLSSCGKYNCSPLPEIKGFNLWLRERSDKILKRRNESQDAQNPRKRLQLDGGRSAPQIPSAIFDSASLDNEAIFTLQPQEMPAHAAHSPSCCSGFCEPLPMSDAPCLELAPHLAADAVLVPTTESTASSWGADAGTAGDHAPQFMSVQDLLREFPSVGGTVAGPVQQLGRMYANFERLVLYSTGLHRVRSEKGLEQRKERVSKEVIRELLAGGGALASGSVERGEWAVETRVEVALSGTEPVGLTKLRVLGRGGEPFLVVVDMLCRDPLAPFKRVGSLLLERVVKAFDGCRVVLCTVRPQNPSRWAQSTAEHDAVVAKYRRAGFVPLDTGDELLEWLVRLRVWAQERARERAASWCTWGDLAGLVEVELGVALPVLEMGNEQRPITFWEYRDSDPAAQGLRGACWARATADVQTPPPAESAVGLAMDGLERLPALAPAPEPAHGAGPLGDAGWEKWARRGAAVEVHWGGDWWNARVAKERRGRFGGAEVLVHYVGGKKSEVRPRVSNPQLRILFAASFQSMCPSVSHSIARLALNRPLPCFRVDRRTCRSLVSAVFHVLAYIAFRPPRRALLTAPRRRPRPG